MNFSANDKLHSHAEMLIELNNMTLTPDNYKLEWPRVEEVMNRTWGNDTRDVHKVHHCSVEEQLGEVSFFYFL